MSRAAWLVVPSCLNYMFLWDQIETKRTVIVWYDSARYLRLMYYPIVCEGKFFYDSFIPWSTPNNNTSEMHVFSQQSFIVFFKLQMRQLCLLSKPSRWKEALSFKKISSSKSAFNFCCLMKQLVNPYCCPRSFGERCWVYCTLLE